MRKKGTAKKTQRRVSPKRTGSAAQKRPQRSRPTGGQIKKKDEALKDRRVSEFMSVTAITIGKEQSLAQAHELMRKKGIRHLPVLEGGKIFGIVSQRDLHLVETFRDVDPNTVTVEEAATRDPFRVRYDESVGAVARVMAERKIGATLVVDDDDTIVGVFTTIDALRAIIA